MRKSSTWEKFHLPCRACLVCFVVPSRECSEKKYANDANGSGNKSGVLLEYVSSQVAIFKYIKPEKIMLSLNMMELATRFNGSWVTLTIDAKEFAFLRQVQCSLPDRMHIPK